MGRPRLLDLYSGAGGATRGYQLAGFHVTGVDHRPQPRYCGDAFVQADALEFAVRHGTEYDVIHASPPCQRYSVGTRRWRGRSERHPDLVGPTREALEVAGRPWVIENVVGAPLRDPVLLCGTMFGLKVYRHRLFESPSLLLMPLPPHRRHRESTGSHRGYGYRHPVVCVAGHNFNLAEGKAAMGIDWMANRRELAQAVPPVYCFWVGRCLRAALGRD